jgi:hypothetical protein
LLVDIGWAKVYYDYVEDTTLQDVPDDAAVAAIEGLHADRGYEDTDEAWAQATTEARREGLLEQEVPIVLRDRVCVEYVPWDMIRYDGTANQIEDVRWVCQYTLMPTQEVRHNPQWRAFVEDRYGVKDGRQRLDDLQGDTVVDHGRTLAPDAPAAELSPDEFGDDQRITVCEMWDLETGLVTIFPHGRHDIVLYQFVNPLMFNLDLEDRNPFKPLVVRDVPDRLEGLGDMRLMEPALVEIDEYRRNLAQYIARTIPKLIGPELALTENGKKALESLEWGAYVGLQNNATKNEVGTIDPPALPQQAFQVLEMLEREIEDGTGASEVLRGVFTSKRQTAVETDRVASAGERRQSERRGALETWYVDIARTMLQLMQKYYDAPRVMRFVGDLGQDFAWEFSAEDIAKEADLKVNITPVENLTRDERVERWLRVANLLLPMPETSIPDLEQAILRDMGVKEDDITALVKTPEEVEAEKNSEAVRQQLAAAPAPGGGPPGLQLTPASGGGGAPTPPPA